MNNFSSAIHSDSSNLIVKCSKRYVSIFLSKFKVGRGDERALRSTLSQQQQVHWLLTFYLCTIWLLANPIKSEQQHQQQPPFLGIQPPFSSPIAKNFNQAIQSAFTVQPPPMMRMPTTPKMRVVPGSVTSSPILVKQLVLPYESFVANKSQEEMMKSSYVIEQKRFVEAVATRCLASTVLEDPLSVEPSFVIIRTKSEVRVNATVTPEVILQAGYDPKRRTLLLVHGFTQSYPETTWLRQTRALFERNSLVGHQNLIIMDWGRASQGSYAQAAAMVSGMGSFLANFLMKLLELGADRSKIHIVGHSLGAHLSGFAGKRIRPRIGRITALDPAGPCFGKLFLNSPMDRLSPDDAYEVSVYHYDDGFLGLPGQHGQFDVYVNGGSSQPGCNNNVNAMVAALVTTIFRLNRVLSESHTRSTEVFTHQLEPASCQQVAYECRDYPSFSAGECGRCDEQNNQCFLMNFDFQFADVNEIPLRTSFPGKRLYISTGPTDEQFCMLHHQVLVKFEPSPELAQAAKRNKWRIQLELLADRVSRPEESMHPESRMSQGAQFKRFNVSLTNQMAPNVFSALLLTNEPRPSRFRAALLQVRTSDNSLVQLAGNQHQSTSGGSQFKVFAIELNFMSHIDPHARRALSSRLCPAGAQGMATKYQQVTPPQMNKFSPPPPPPQFITTTPSTLIHEFNSIAGSFDNSWTYYEECFAPPN